MRPERIATGELRRCGSNEGRGESGGDLGELAKSAQPVSSLAKGIIASDQLGLAGIAGSPWGMSEILKPTPHHDPFGFSSSVTRVRDKYQMFALTQVMISCINLDMEIFGARARDAISLPAITASLLIFTCIGTPDVRAEPVHSPPVGSAERSAILDALRKPVETTIRLKVKFQVRHMNVQDGWAFVHGPVVKQNGDRIDFTTLYRKIYGEGNDIEGDDIFALLRLKDGRWTVVTYDIGPSDLPCAGWREKYGSPRGILGPYAKFDLK